MRIDSTEAINILASVMAISLALTFANGGLDIESGQFVYYMLIFTTTVGSGFVLHELAHKYVAVKYGAKAAFRAWPSGLVFMLALAIVPQLFGFHFPLFIAPGAVYIQPVRRMITRQQNGIISLAGPMTNIALFILFMAGWLFFSDALPMLGVICRLGAQVNIFLAFFNMLPIFPLDGSKVMNWDWRIWLSIFAFCFIGSAVFRI
jgi:Zn-dependent protease